ncbi:MAG: hypothetical protein ACW991_05705 [Candidatus Hodarchaeales archaeon]
MAGSSPLISWKTVLLISIIGAGGLYGLFLIFNRSTPESSNTPQESNTIDLRSVGVFTYDPAEINTVRPDIFNPGHFSIFDILVHLANKSELTMIYHFDESMNTFVIETINGLENWWYEA